MTKVRTLQTVAKIEDDALRASLREQVAAILEDDTPIAGFFLVVAKADGRTGFVHDFADNQRLVGAVEIARNHLLGRITGRIE